MKKRIAALLAALTLLTGILSGCASKAISGSQARSGAVRILTVYDVFDYETEDYLGQDAATGTAFGVGTAGKETDVFVTNLHVVEELSLEQSTSGEIRIYQRSAVYILLDNFAFAYNTGLDSSRAIPCNVIYGQDENGIDIAVLRAAEAVPGRIALPLQDQESGLDINDEVTALGYPGSSDYATSDGAMLASVEDVTVTSGKTSRFYEPASVSNGTGILDNCRYIQHTAAVNHGNSGGPLIDQNGAVVGVNTNIYQSANYAETTAYYALRIQYVKDALDSLGIHYDVYKAGPNMLAIAVAAVAVAAVIAVVAVVALRKKKPAPLPDGVPVSGPAPAQELRIQGQSGAFAGRRFAINGQVRIGRDPNSNDLVYPDGTPGISGRHCVVTLAGSQVTLTDLGSSYGTFLAGGRKLAPNQPATLRMGDRFYLGSEKEAFVITGKGGSMT